MTGIGEVLCAAPALPACGVLLVNPGVAVPTADVFRARTGAVFRGRRVPARWPDAAGAGGDLARSSNDLEAPALPLAPAIGTVLARLARLPGCLLARMSGSGATCFGLFADAAAAEPAATPAGTAGGWRAPAPLYEPAAAALLTARQLGRRQAVRQRILIPPFGGSIPPAPTILLFAMKTML